MRGLSKMCRYINYYSYMQVHVSKMHLSQNYCIHKSASESFGSSNVVSGKYQHKNIRIMGIILNYYLPFSCRVLFVSSNHSSLIPLAYSDQFVDQGRNADDGEQIRLEIFFP